MKSKQVIAVAAIGAITAGIAYYFASRRSSGTKNKAVDNTQKDSHADLPKRVHRSKSPIRKFTHKAKLSAN